jgi:predicted nucleic acid-binding protein
MTGPTLVDACVWVDWLGGRAVPELEALLERGTAAICGTVLAEVLSGVKSVETRRALAQRLQSVEYLSESRSAFTLAADTYAGLRARGITLPLSDCMLAALCSERDAAFLTFDQHFRVFQEPERFRVVPRPA